jgi:hypothetical protein
MRKELFFINDKKVNEKLFWDQVENSYDKRKAFDYLFNYLIKQDKSQDQELAIFKIKKTIFKVLVKNNKGDQ